MTACTGPGRIVLQGGNVGTKATATIVLEAVASEDLWIWHSFFGLPGSHDDLNVLSRSPLFARLVAGDAPSNLAVAAPSKFDQYLI